MNLVHYTARRWIDDIFRDAAYFRYPRTIATEVIQDVPWLSIKRTRALCQCFRYP